MSTLKKLREQHATLVAEARKILESTDGPITGEAEKRFDTIMADADKVEAQCKREQDLLDRESRMQAGIAEKAEKTGKSEDEQVDAEKRYAEAFGLFMRYGNEALAPEQRELMQASFVSPASLRAQSVSGGSPAGIYGGYLVPEGFVVNLEQSMLAFGGMLEAADIFETSTGQPLLWPTENDTANKGAILGENQPITEQDETFAQIAFTHYLYTSKLIRVSWQLMQDSAFNLEQHVQTIAATRLSRILNDHFTTGTGSGQPSGVVTGAGLGVTTGLQAAVTYDELVDLQHSVDPAYRNNPKSIWMFNDTTLKQLRKLKDADNRPLFWNDTGNLAAGIQPQLLGHRYVINQSMASQAASAKFALFGDFSKYKIRRIKGYTLVVLRERYADQLQTGFFVYARFDGRMLDAGTDPIKYLQNKSASP